MILAALNFMLDSTENDIVDVIYVLLSSFPGKTEK